MSASSLVIEPAASSKQRMEFIKFPFWLYHQRLKDPNWVAPLIMDRKDLLNPEKNPFFEHSEAEFFLARRDGQVVGTIAAILNNNHNKTHEEKTGFFGLFECVEDYAVAEALLGKARDWVKAKGMDRLRGPLSMDINGEIGLLIDGFDDPPVILMTYNPQYYEGFMERLGFAKAKDIYAYTLRVQDFRANLPEKVVRVAKKMQSRHNIVVRPLDMKHFDEEIAKIKVVYDEAWAKNWGDVAMTEAEFRKMAYDLKLIMDPGLVYVAEIGGKVVGVSVGIPDANQILIHLNGRLFPFGWLKFLWYRRKVKSMRLLIMGVLEEHRLKGIDALFYLATADTAIPAGYIDCEMSWILEDNYKIRRGIEALGGRVYRTYRIYDSALV
jgi:GNAT superfamily N-acetyltransferase